MKKQGVGDPFPPEWNRTAIHLFLSSLCPVGACDVWAALLEWMQVDRLSVAALEGLTFRAHRQIASGQAVDSE